jgi:hypothetical protein
MVGVKFLVGQTIVLVFLLALICGFVLVRFLTGGVRGE